MTITLTDVSLGADVRRDEVPFLAAPTSAFLVGAIWLTCAAPDLPLRYLVYLAPAAIFFDRLLKRALAFNDVKFVVAFVLATVVIGVAAMRGPMPEQALFILLGPACALLKFRFQRAAADALFLGVAVIQIYLAISTGFSFDSRVFINSTSSAETNSLPFILALFSIYFLINRKFANSLFAILFLLIAGKRIAILSVVFAAPVALLPGFFWRAIKNYSSCISFLIFVTFGISALKVAEVSVYIANKLNENVNVLTMGRFHGQRLAYSQVEHADGWSLFLGNGIGFADRLAAVAWRELKIPVHNDYLRVIVDVGWLGWGIVFLMYTQMLKRSFLGFAFAVFLAMAWMTDNLLIYVFFVLTLVLLLRADGRGRSLFGPMSVLRR